MKRRPLVGAIILVIFFLSGCFYSEEKSEELIDYYNGWLKTRDDANPSSMFTLLTTDNNEKAKQLLNEEVLPIFEDSLHYLESIELEFKENRELYELHVKAEKAWLEFFQAFDDQLDETEVFRILEKTDEEQQEINQLVDDFTEKREELMEKYEVYWIIDYDEHGNELDRMGKDR